MVDSVKTPELEKMAKVSEESNFIGAFMDWLNQEKGITFSVPHTHSDEMCYGPHDHDIHTCHVDSDGCFREREWVCPFGEGQLLPAHLSPETVLAEYFKIDLDKVEQEKRVLLDQIRKANG